MATEDTIKKHEIARHTVALKVKVYETRKIAEAITHVATRDKLVVALTKAYDALDEVQVALAWGAYE